ncbi:MAG: hypothetical protein MUP21_02025, partial [Dehalococcoidia bacterium]|nr:hypothetical protein [Dehalococcoidia bacterium]
MGRLAEVNQTLAVGLKLFDGDTGQFIRARVYNSGGTEQTGAPISSPISLTHRALGFYSATFTPTVEGEYFVVYRVFSDAGFTILNKKYEEVMEIVNIRSVDQDLATLLTRIGTPVGTVSSDIAGIQTKLGTPAGASVSADIAAVQADTDDIQVKIGTPAGASVSADIAAVKSDTGTINTKIGTPAGTVSTDIAGIQTKLGTPAGASVSADIAAVQADTDDIQVKIGTPVGVSVSADIAAVQADT